MHTVGFVRHNFLPPSETFLYGTLSAIEHYRVRVFAITRRSRAKFPYDDVTALRELRLGWLEEALYRATTYSPRLKAWGRTLSLLHAHMGWTGAHVLSTARSLGLPLVTSFYGQDVTLRGTALLRDPAFWHYWALGARLFSRGDRFLVLSRHMERALVARGCPPEKIRVVPLGVDLARFEGSRRRGRGGPLSVLMVGREVEKKGFDDGLRACAKARELGVTIRPILLGTGGPDLPALRRLADKLELEVAFPDPATRVPEAMAEADLLLVPSHTARDGDAEGTPTVICEGSAAELPIVATRHAGIPEQVADGVTGLLAGERDVEGLATHLVALARDPDLRIEMGRQGRAKMQREYSYAAHTAKVEAVYRELLGAPTASPRVEA